MNSKSFDAITVALGLLMAVAAITIIVKVSNRLAPEVSEEIVVADKTVYQAGGKARHFVWEVHFRKDGRMQTEDVSFDQWQQAQIGQPLTITYRKVFNY